MTAHNQILTQRGKGFISSGLWFNLIVIILFQIVATVLYLVYRAKDSIQYVVWTILFLAAEICVASALFTWYRKVRAYRDKLRDSCLFTQSVPTIPAYPTTLIEPPTRTVVVYVPVERGPSITDEELDDEIFWCNDHSRDHTDTADPCPICLYDADTEGDEATGSTKCCNRYIHIICAQRYFLSVRKVQCPFCRCTDFCSEP